MRKLRILIKFADGSPLRSIKKPAQILRHEVCSDRKKRFENAEISALKEPDQNPSSGHASNTSIPYSPYKRERNANRDTEKRPLTLWLDPPIHVASGWHPMHVGGRKSLE